MMTMMECSEMDDSSLDGPLKRVFKQKRVRLGLGLAGLQVELVSVALSWVKRRRKSKSVKWFGDVKNATKYFLNVLYCFIFKMLQSELSNVLAIENIIINSV